MKKKFVDFQNLKKFENSIIHKPSLGSRDIPQNIWARSVQPLVYLLDTNKQTDTQTSRQAKYIHRCRGHSVANILAF